ncbi:MAG: DUF6795 domain-containing protein [Pseudomonadota bacterium]
MMKHKRLMTLLGLPFSTLLLITAGYYPGSDMFNWFKYYDAQLSPEIHGRILKNGEPLSGVTVYRELFHAKNYVAKTVTDADGRFAFPAKTIQSREPGKLFGVEHITHSITADHGDRTYLLWHYTKSTRHPEQVIDEKLSDLFCELNNPEQLHHFDNAENPNFTHNIRGICHWPSSPPTATGPGPGAESGNSSLPSEPPLEYESENGIHIISGLLAWLKRYDVELSPTVEGRLTESGTALKGVRITRELNYEKSYVDETYTDEEGRFSFTPKTIRSRLPRRPLTEARTIQVIVAHTNKDDLLLWQAATDALEIPETLRNYLSQLDCDVQNPQRTHHLPNKEHPHFPHNIGSICQWPDQASSGP